MRRAIRRLKNIAGPAVVLDAMIGRHNQVVHGVVGMCLRVSLPNVRNIVRVHGSYRAFLHGRAFHPYRGELDGKLCQIADIEADLAGIEGVVFEIHPAQSRAAAA
jgi:hypothetical protein